MYSDILYSSRRRSKLRKAVPRMNVILKIVAICMENPQEVGGSRKLSFRVFRKKPIRREAQRIRRK